MQALRGIAALFVVAFHATVLWHDRFDGTARVWWNGNAGVDLFFVISGFIIVYASSRLAGRPGAASIFLKTRLVRIVPLYWLATGLKLAVIAALPALVQHTSPTPSNIAASFAFLPSRDATGAIRPVLDVGWTLSYEMLFYLLFATGLALVRTATLLVAPLLLALAAGSLAIPPDAPAIATLADPLVLEFLFGMMIATLALRGTRQAPLPLAALVALGLLMLALAPADTRWQRALVWGLAATVCVGAAVATERRLGPRIPNLLVAAGECSYSTYLIHGFVLPVLGLAAARLVPAPTLARSPLAEPALIVICLVASTLAGHVVYRLVERPLTNHLRRRVLPAPAPLAKPESPL